ncbi:MAG: hypothetical protein SFU25_06850 [Candidatus Caenarcaniphilales bacterium]|nr:hypothetical protein [Candidatus Caenarcaniphilales bacterium]
MFGSAYGVSGSFGQTTDNPRITNDHPIFSGNLSYGAFGTSGSFQHGELKAVSGGAGLLLLVVV